MKKKSKAEMIDAEIKQTIKAIHESDQKYIEHILSPEDWIMPTKMQGLKK